MVSVRLQDLLVCWLPAGLAQSCLSPAVSEQSLNSPRPDLDPSVPGQRKYPGTLQGWIEQRGQRAGRGGGGELACWETPRHLVILSPVLACCDGRRAQSWFVKAVSCLPTSPHLGSAHGTTGHNLGAEILLTTAPTTNHQGDQQYSKTTSTTTVFSPHQANT